MVSGTRISRLINNLQNLAVSALNELKAFFANRKVTLMENFSRKLPPRPDERTVPGTRLHERSSVKAGDIPRVIHPARDDEKQREGVLRSYAPGGDAFQRAMRRVGVTNINQVSTELLARYADRVNEYRGRLSCQELEKMLPNDLMILVVEHQQQVGASEAPAREPEHGIRRRRVGVETTSSKTSRSPESSKSAKAAGSQTSVTSQPLKPLDPELPQEVAAFNWLHVNRRQVAINFNKVGKELLQQAEAAKEKYAQSGERPRHLTFMVHAYCQKKDWHGLSRYLHNLSDNQMKVFTPEMTRGLNILAFQESLCNDLIDRMSQLSPDDRMVCQQVLNAARSGNWSEVATLCSLYEGELIPPHILLPLKAVIPGFTVKFPKQAEPVQASVSTPAEYRPPVEVLAATQRKVPPALSLKEIEQRIVWPERKIDIKGEAALLQIRYGLEHQDSETLHLSIIYLMRAGKFPIVDPATYRAIKYMEMKRQVQNHLNAIATFQTSEENRVLVSQAIGLVESNSWSQLADLDHNYHRSCGQSLIGSDMQDKMRDYNRLPTS
ncbi:MAG: hypothetical protein ACR2PT_23910 [Endozoicomonas sp.]